MADECVNLYKEALRVALRRYSPGGFPGGALDGVQQLMRGAVRSLETQPWQGGGAPRHEEWLGNVYLGASQVVDRFQAVLESALRHQPATVPVGDWRCSFGGGRPRQAV